MKQNDVLRKVKYWALGIILLTLTASCSNAPVSSFPWNLQNHSIPPFQILDTDNPGTEQFSILYTVEACVPRNSSRDDIKIISEKIIEGLPKHNGVIIFFFADPSEKRKEYTVAKTNWNPEQDVHDDSLVVAGDYSKNVMRIAMKGQELPGQVVKQF